MRVTQHLPVFEVQLVARRWHEDFWLLMNPSEVSDDNDEEDNSNQGHTEGCFQEFQETPLDFTQYMKH